MPTPPKTVAQYLAALPADRREIVEAIRATIRANLDAPFEEGIQYGMIGYYLPHSVYPDGYHCDPKQPLPFASIGNQKGHVGIYLFCVYMDPGGAEKFAEAWRKKVGKIDMGKSCIRVKKPEDVAHDVLGRTIRAAKAKKFVATYEASRPASGAKRKPAAKKTATRKKAASGTPASRKKASGKR